MDTLTRLFKQYPKVFVTGTDTEVGKTYCSSLIIKHLQQNQIDIFPYKPIAAGTEFDQELQNTVNEDAKSLWLAADKKYSLEQINPIKLDSPIAPHIAALEHGLELNKALLDANLDMVEDLGQAQLIEGAGGWLLPLNDQELLSDWVAEKQLPVIMVVSIKLGCLNHALLTAQAIEASGCKIVGWIANFNHGETSVGRKNLEFIQQKLSAPLLFEVQSNQQHIEL